jgi:uncharacterized SAM-binding protein YcdF (DUF218 family)
MPLAGCPNDATRRLDMKSVNRKRSLICILVILLLLGAALVGLRDAGRWLVREDSLARADVIYVLSGGMPGRAEEAGKIFSQGYAPEVWVSRAVSPADELQGLGIRYVGEEEYSREILIHEGVPDAAIHILPQTVANTEQEVEEARWEMHRTGKTRIIIVTSPQHTRRVKALWHKLVGDSPEAIVRAAREDPFNADHWWRNTRDTYSVIREMLGLINVWTGLPVHPPPN